MIQKDFDVKAMEEKIRINVEKGIDIKQIKILLREELIENRKQALFLDKRATELLDQIEYIDDNYKEKS